MPTTEQILGGLVSIANQWQMLAIFWHIYFALLIVGLLLRICPTQQFVGYLLALPLLSVSILAWTTGNPFNGTLFALAAVVLLIIAYRLPKEAIDIAPPWLMTIGLLLFLFGWVYPHFLTTGSWVQYLYAAPTGLIPCPTLAIVIGATLVVDGLNSKAWSLVLGSMGIFYGLFGALRLGVTIDLVLLIGAVVLVLIAFLPHGHSLVRTSNQAHLSTS